MNYLPPVAPERLERDAYRRRNGDALDAPPEPGHEPGHTPPPLRRRLDTATLAALGGALGLTGLVVLGLWKLVELVSRAT